MQHAEAVRRDLRSVCNGKINVLQYVDHGDAVHNGARSVARKELPKVRLGAHRLAIGVAHAQLRVKNVEAKNELLLCRCRRLGFAHEALDHSARASQRGPQVEVANAPLLEIRLQSLVAVKAGIGGRGAIGGCGGGGGSEQPEHGRQQRSFQPRRTLNRGYFDQVIWPRFGLRPPNHGFRHLIHTRSGLFLDIT
eukprot:scaffold26929_cov129-Isochrysis_galbana.AAC.1